jgi:hypothetical protein
MFNSLDQQPATERSAPTELARYQTPGGTRVLVARHLDGCVHITDRPTSGEGRSYAVDSGFESAEQLQAFLTDYLDQAARLDACPMSPEAIARMVDNGPTRAREAIS